MCPIYLRTGGRRGGTLQPELCSQAAKNSQAAKFLQPGCKMLQKSQAAAGALQPGSVLQPGSAFAEARLQGPGGFCAAWAAELAGYIAFSNIQTKPPLCSGMGRAVRPGLESSLSRIREPGTIKTPTHIQRGAAIPYIAPK